MTLLRIIPLWVYLAIAGILGGWYAVERIDGLKTQRDEAQLSADQASAREASIRSTLDLQRQLYTDAQKVSDEYWQRIKVEEDKSAQLQRDLDAGSKRLHVNATCVPGASTNSATVGSTDGNTPRLTDSAQRGYLDLRAGFQKQRQQIIGLQTYITNICLKGQAK